MKHNTLPEISIPVPCHENWNNMSSTEKGKFCLKCKKEVLDFTKHSKTYLQKIVSERNESTCGRVLKSQLKVSEKGNKNFHSWRFTFFKKIAASILSVAGIKFLTVTSVNAQTIELRNPSENDLNRIGITPVLNNNDSTISIQGIIKDSETKESIAFPTIVISENGTQLTGVVGDIDGNFELKISKRKLNDEFDITISYLGYKSIEIRNIPFCNLNYDMQLEMQSYSLDDPIYMMVGMLSVNPVYANPDMNPNEKSFNQNDIRHMPH